MRRLAVTLALTLSATLVTACGGDDASSLSVSWSFDAGDCAANNVDTVRVMWGRSGGALATLDFACEDGVGVLGDIGGGGTFSITAEGLDAAGVTRARSFGTSLTVGASGTGGSPVDVTLHPASANVTVSWTVAGGGGCPPGVILPYFITLYTPPAVAGGPLTNSVANVQESCSTGQATLTSVAPGDYVVEVDSRAVTPALRGTQPVTVVAGEDAAVSITL